MPKKQQTNNTQPNQIDKLESLQALPEGIIRAFSNPICKQTYYSLPRIYGKKKKKQVDPETSKQCRARLQLQKTKSRNYFSSNQTPNHLRRKKINIKIISGTANTQVRCNKVNCTSHIHFKQQTQAKNKKKIATLFSRSILLPQMRKFELEDLESQHKVILQSFSTKVNFTKTGLEKIIQQNEKIKSINGSKPQSPRSNNNKVQINNNKNENEKQEKLSKINLNTLKNKHKTKNLINNQKFQIQQQSDQQQQGHFKRKQKQQKNKKIPRTQTARFQSDAQDSQQSKSSNSMSLNSLIFRGTKKQNTKFYELNLSGKNMERRLSRKPSQLSNGLFRIPQQDQYADYIRDYNPVNQNFNIFQIAKRPGFRVQKSQKGLYFGQFDYQLRKHGQGINVSQKQIFEGQYQKNKKTSGSERNIDGVYIGQFKNGLRSGHGIFRWNNGQSFEGKWENGLKNGFGIWRSPKGDSYEGEWFQNRQHGKGIFKHRTSTYNGQFKNFLKDGYGIQHFSNGDQYEGQYKAGKPHGRGKYKWHGGGQYDGQFVNGMREGRGKWIDQHKTIYQGFFKSDFKNGYGKQRYSSGQIFQGQFKQGVRTKGKIYDKNHNFIQINQQ